MNRVVVIVALALTLTCGSILAQDKPKTDWQKIDWDEQYQDLLESDPDVRKKIESGQATKAEVIDWLKSEQRKNAQSDFRKKLNALIEAGKLSKEEAEKLAATMDDSKKAEDGVKKRDAIDWEAAYQKLLKNPAVRRKIENGGATKEQVIQYLKDQAAKKSGNGKRGGMKAKPGAREGSVNFYAVVIGRLRSKDIELGELELEVDYVLSEANWAKKELVGQRVKLVGVAGAFLDNLLRIKRGETIKVRTGDFNPKTKVLGFGYKFQVLERTPPFKPEDFGVPPEEFRGFRGELVGNVVEALGYEVVLDVKESKPEAESNAKDHTSIHGKRVRIAGFYIQHADAFGDLHAGDKIRVGVAHLDPESDAVNVTEVLQKVGQ